jgi:hypothetical protein
MNRKNVLFLAVLTAGFFAGNIFGSGTITDDLTKAAGKVVKRFKATKVKNKTKGDIWITFNTLSEKCPGGCNYTRIGKGDNKSLEQSRYGSLLNVYAYELGANHKPLKGYEVQKDAVEVSVKNGKIQITEIGD